MMILKALHSLQAVYFLKYILKVKVWIFFFLNVTSILVFENELRKIVWKVTR